MSTFSRVRRAAASRVRKPRVAALTAAKDEGRMLQRWVDHYGDQLGRENLLVLDDGSSDGSTDALRCPVHRLPDLGGERFWQHRMAQLSAIAAGLLELGGYDRVIFTDTDEFLIADPARYDGLLDLLADRRGAKVLGGHALNVLHLPEVEPELDDSAPVLGQRRYAKFVPLMCKPSIKSVDAAWGQASHGIRAPYTLDPELFLIHLKFYDLEHLRATSDHRKALNEADGRAQGSSWSKDGDFMVRQLLNAAQSGDPASAPEFATSSTPADLIGKDKGWWRPPRVGQLEAMRDQPLVRVPERLFGLV